MTFIKGKTAIVQPYKEYLLNFDIGSSFEQKNKQEFDPEAGLFLRRSELII